MISLHRLRPNVALVTLLFLCSTPAMGQIRRGTDEGRLLRDAAARESRGDFDGAMLLSPCRSVHTFGMKFVLDVAFLDKGNNVVSVVTVVPGRVVIRLRSRSVIEARAGAFERWGLEVGQELEVKS